MCVDAKAYASRDSSDLQAFDVLRAPFLVTKKLITSLFAGNALERIVRANV